MSHIGSRLRGGRSRIDTLATVACAGLLVIVASVVLGQTRPSGGPPAEAHPLSVKDASQLAEIHQAMVIFANEWGGLLPRPGLINRLPVELDGQLRQIPGRGEEDISLNTTANLYSSLIAQNYFAPTLVISPVERSPEVSVRGSYDYNQYDPAEDVYWDPQFKADLLSGSHTSYAHLLLFGKRVDAQWRDTMDPKFPVLGNRGPKGGKLDPSSYTCGPHGNWAGNVVYNDNHVEFEVTTTPSGLFFQSGEARKPDNIFAIDDGPRGRDAVLTFTKRMTASGPLLQHD